MNTRSKKSIQEKVDFEWNTDNIFNIGQLKIVYFHIVSALSLLILDLLIIGYGIIAFHEMKYSVK
ncbi:MAG: hypothetical protein HYU67_10415 [Flavobacteriia bacterium]|nr:hypothetical protein [Flavobacteriia bacterium]